jgi:hypothetical protein
MTKVTDRFCRRTSVVLDEHIKGKLWPNKPKTVEHAYRPSIYNVLAHNKRVRGYHSWRNGCGCPILNVQGPVFVCMPMMHESISSFLMHNGDDLKRLKLFAFGGGSWQLRTGRSVANTMKRVTVISFAHAYPAKCKLDQPRAHAPLLWHFRLNAASTVLFHLMSWDLPFSG